MNVAYVRESEFTRKHEAEGSAFSGIRIDKWFTEKVRSEPGQDVRSAMLKYVRKGDTLYIRDLAQIARSTPDLCQVTEELRKKEVRLISRKEQLDTDLPSGKMMLTMIRVIADFERQTQSERREEGLAFAKEKGVRQGRKPFEVPDFACYYTLLTEKKIRKCTLAKELGITRPTLDHMIRDYENSLR